MSKTKKSVYNLIASVAQVLIMQVITLVVSKKVLEVYGSDINGVNSVFTNTLVWLMLLEGGFTFASSVALFKAYATSDHLQANRILSATKKALNRIGLLVGLGGVILAIVAPFFIKTTLSYNLMLGMFLLMALGTFIGLSFTRKYALMFSVKQEEYIKVYISILVAIVVNAVIYVIASYQMYYLWVRVVVAIGVILTALLTYILVKRRYPYVSYKEEPDMEAIKGTRDMVFNKFASLVNASVPLIYIASVIGAAYASVYAVYMIVFGFITKLSLMLANAVQNGFGQMMAEKAPEEVFHKFKTFEFSLIFMLLFLISVSSSLTLPFIEFYTRNVNDVDYISPVYLLLFTLITFTKVVHNPSGIVMLMSGAFKESKRMQVNAVIILIIGIVIGGLLWEVSGILVGILLAAIVLATQEIIYTRKHYFKIGYTTFLKPLFILGGATLLMIWLEMGIIGANLSFMEIVYQAIFLGTINLTIFATISYFTFREQLVELGTIFTTLLKRKKTNNV